MAPRAAATSRKRKAASVKSAAEAEAGSSGAGAVAAAGNNQGKRARKEAKPKPQDEYFEEKRDMEDLWQAAFSVGTEWENMDKIKEINWSFSHLEKAFEEGGELHGKKVYMFGGTEPQLVVHKGEGKIVLIPYVAVAVCDYPPSDKIGIKSVQREKEEIVPMKTMKMGWVPYIPQKDRQSQVERFKTQIFVMECTQRRSALKLLKEERVKQFDYCLPYFQPLKAEEDEEDTNVSIMYPLEPPIVCEFDWDLDDAEEFASGFVADGTLAEEEKQKFIDFVKEQVRERKRELRQAKEARQKAINDMNPAVKAAIEGMQLYKFYPEPTDDTPDLTEHKVSFINRYYGKAHYVR